MFCQLAEIQKVAARHECREFPPRYNLPDVYHKVLMLACRDISRFKYSLIPSGISNKIL